MSPPLKLFKPSLIPPLSTSYEQHLSPPLNHNYLFTIMENFGNDTYDNQNAGAGFQDSGFQGQQQSGMGYEGGERGMGMNSGMGMGGGSMGRTGGGGGDMLDKGVDFLEKKAGHEQVRI
jgi:hypothetical protein